jgi:uncharacterized DUF497 family protein
MAEPLPSLTACNYCVAIKQVHFTFDPARNEKNKAERGLSFAVAAELDWGAALIVEDTRHDYGELRLRAPALLNGRLHTVVVTPR